jgi:hypothetical protein
MGAAATPSIVTTVAMTLVTAGVLVISFRTPNAWLWG